MRNDLDSARPPPTPPIPPESSGALGTISDFFSNNAWLSLVTVLLLLGLFAGLMRVSSRLRPPDLLIAQSDSSISTTRSVQPAWSAMRCGQILVVFNPTAPLRELARLLQSLDAVLVYGPNENGGFEIRVAPDVVRRTTDALEKSPLIRVASIQPDCH